MKRAAKHSWILLLVVGLAVGYFAYDNLVVIPWLDPADPDRGWSWLTSDPEIIEYIKFHFRIFGFWVLAFAVFVIVTSITGYRRGEKWAWYSLLYLPVHIVIHMFLWPWTIPILLLLLIMTLTVLILPWRDFFLNGLLEE